MTRQGRSSVGSATAGAPVAILGPDALRFDGDLTGGSVALQGIPTLGQDPDPRSGTMEFTC